MAFLLQFSQPAPSDGSLEPHWVQKVSLSSAAGTGRAGGGAGVGRTGSTGGLSTTATAALAFIAAFILASSSVDSSTVPANSWIKACTCLMRRSSSGLTFLPPNRSMVPFRMPTP